ncbi:MAG: hypothetical protein KIT87_13840 [Anaerolineae bacterium]|nr:hypothetical protein [Anaerolineae bacterium]
MRRGDFITWTGLCLVLALGLRLVWLASVPREWYGDISILHYYVASILRFEWPFGYQLSAGPVYHYLIAPLIALLGYSYLAYKLASVLVSFLGLGGLAWLGYLLGGPRLSLGALFVGACSSWYLIFSRLGNSQILIPVVTALTLCCVLLAWRGQGRRWVVLGAAVSTTGLYIYPQTFVVPALFLLLLGLAVLLPRPSAARLRAFLLALLIIGVLAIPFGLIVVSQPDNFGSGYVGSKLFGSGQPLSALAGRLGENLVKTALMLHVRGDIVFRSNPPQSPQLDRISGILFLIGLLVMLLRRGERAHLALLVGSMLVLVFPSVWPNLPAIEVPSASRTLGITPLVYLLVARGLLAVYAGLSRVFRRPRFVPPLAVGLLMAVIVTLNATRYFVDYADHLPYHNAAFGSRIGQTIDLLPAQTQVYVIGCCWGEWEMPEKESILFATRRRDIQFVTLSRVCEAINPALPLHAFFGPEDEAAAETLQTCAPQGVLTTERSEAGDVIYREYAVGSPGS